MNAQAEFDTQGPKVQTLRRRLQSVWALRAFMLTKLPLGLLAGLRIVHLDAQSCSASVPYRWLTTNPFRSTYFAALSMAAEMSSGALGLTVVQSSPVPVSILIVGLEAQFTKKATGLTTFTCHDGQALADAVAETLKTGEAVVVETTTVGVSAEGVEVARFAFTWSFRRKSS